MYIKYEVTRTPDTRPDQEVAELLNRAEEDDEYTMLDHPPPTVLPPRPAVKLRGNPLDQTTFYLSMNEEGRIINEDYIKKIIFHGVSYIKKSPCIICEDFY